MLPIQETVRRWGPPTDHPHALYEFVGGTWKEVPRMGSYAAFLASHLDRRIGNFTEEHQLGHSMVETLFRLAVDGPARRPDVAYVAKDRWTYTSIFEEDPPAFDVVPNLAVEVNSPSNTGDEILDKVHDYFFHGVQLIWVVYPRRRLVHVHENPEQIRVLSEKHELDGGTVLPGFKLSLAALFASHRLS